MPRLCSPRWFAAFMLVLPGLCPHTAPAQGPVDKRLLAELPWRNVGPFRGGRAGAVTGVIGQPGTFYAGYPGGGVWKTTSAGQVWTPLFDGVKDVSSVGAVEVAPSDPDVVYVGTGDMLTGGTLDQGNGVYRSMDAGRTWQHVGLALTRHIQTMLVDPRDANVVLVGALGDPIARSEWRGVFRSTDGGRTWSKTLFVDDATGIAKLARAYDVPQVIYATTVTHWVSPAYAQRSLRSWQFGLGTRVNADTTRTGTAIWKSLDGGATWTELRPRGLPRLEGRTSLAVAQGTNAERLYLIGNDGLYRSDDGGASWTTMAADDERIRSGQGGYSCGVYVDPKNPDVVYTINTAAYKSVDGGHTFTGWKGAPGGDDPQQLWIDPTDGRRILMGLDQGATITLDGGATWSSWYNQSVEQVYHIATDRSYPYWIYATQQDAGAIRTRSRGNNGAITMHDWNPVNGWEWGTIVPDPKNPNVVYASGNGLVQITYPSEQWINVSPAIDPAAKARTSSSQPIVWAPWNASMLLAGLNYVAATTDGGAHWRRLSPELGVPKGMDSATAAKTPGARGSIESMSASTIAKGVIWVGTSNGLVHVTRDEGTTWTDVSIPGIPAPLRANVSAVEASHHAAGVAYVAIEYLRDGDFAPYLYRTRDYGTTWTRITTGLPVDEASGSFARVIRADTKRAGLLYAGTESGMHVSFDDGDHWQPFNDRLPNTPVRDIEVRDDDLVIGTHGRGIWILDDVARLRQLAAVPTRPTLFAPGAAVRVRRNTNWNTPFPPEIPHAENPVDGVTLDYWLPNAASGPLTIDVLDAAGRVVRHLSSVTPAPVPEAARPPHPDFWLAPPSPLATSAGMHRAHWDLRHDAPASFTHSFEINATPGRTPVSPEGRLALPGRYTLRLVVDGVTSTQTVAVRNDPRSPVTAAGLAAQHALLASLVGAAQVAYEAQQAATVLRTSLSSATSSDASLTSFEPVAALGAALDSVAGAADDARVARVALRTLPPSFRDLNGAFVSQYAAHDNADLAPTAAMQAAFAASCKTLGEQLVRWRRVVERAIPAVNATLVSRGRPTLRAPDVRAATPGCREHAPTKSG